MSATAVFICHSPTDRAFCETLAEPLRRAGLTVWDDAYQLEGQVGPDERERRLAESRVCVIVLSKAALSSPRLRSEARRFDELCRADADRRLVSVLLDAIPPSDLWPFLLDYPRIERQPDAPSARETLIAGVTDAIAGAPVTPSVTPTSPPPAAALRRGFTSRLLVVRGSAAGARRHHDGETALPSRRLQLIVSVAVALLALLLAGVALARQEPSASGTGPQTSHASLAAGATPTPRQTSQSSLPPSAAATRAAASSTRVGGASASSPSSSPNQNPQSPPVTAQTTATTGASSGQTCSGATPLDRSAWSVTTSSGWGQQYAIDGNPGTFWTSGNPQQSGMWFLLDMKGQQHFCALTLLTNTDTTRNDYPRGYQVFGSNDSINWSGPIASGAGNTGTTTIPFAPQSARYIKIVETGSDPTWWWSIDELNVYG